MGNDGDDKKSTDAPAVTNAPTLPGTQINLAPGAAPLMPTLMPHTGAPLPTLAPPALPADARYAFGAEIARGGMGRVVEATDTVLGRTVALKEALSADSDAVRRFLRETRITARLEHPSIVPVHDAGTSAGGSPYYVMRKISGRPLEQLIAKADKLHDRLALVPHLVAAARAVAHAHERGVVHRDIKPANILVGDLGETIVIDWGLAKAMGEADEPAVTKPNRQAAGAAVDAIPDEDPDLKTRAGIVYGTPGFMSAEQLRGVPADERSDVYALGATLHHLLARKPPHFSKSAEAMMQAAVEGPAESLRAVRGVPPELATIVDKALAHDPANRYQNARELAEDLQRFLTGQLVASHHYSPGERVARFVRRNRALVGVTTAAIVTVAVGGTLAIRDIVRERDKANYETVLAQQHADNLALANARNLVDRDPTRAVAELGPLAHGVSWKKARDIAAAARLRGVAFSLPASPHTRTLELSRDGAHALAAGEDGKVELYDLATRSERPLLAVDAPVGARFASDGAEVVAWHGDRVTIVDAASAKAREVTAAAPIVELDAAGSTATWIDRDGAAWRLDLTQSAAQRVALAEPAHGVRISPDGKWTAFAGAQHLILVGGDRAEPVALEGPTGDLSWSADSQRLTTYHDGQVMVFDMAMPDNRVGSAMVANPPSVASVGGTMYAANKLAFGRVRRDGVQHRIEGEFTVGVRVAWNGAVVAAGPSALAVITDDADRIIPPPVGGITQLAASPAAPWVVAAAEGRLLVWNLDAIVPRRLMNEAPAGFGFGASGTVIAGSTELPVRQLDVKTGEATNLGDPSTITAVEISPSNARAVAVDLEGHVRVVLPGGQARELPGEADRAAFLDDDHVVTAHGGALALVDLERAAPVALGSHAGSVTALAVHAPWIVAAFDDGTLWRANGGAPALLAAGARVPGGALAVTADGTVVFAIGADVRAWPAGGAAAVPLTTMAAAVDRVLALGGDRALAVAHDGSSQFITARAGGVHLPGPRLGASVTTARAGELIAWLTSTGAVSLYDSDSYETWTLPHVVSSRVQLAPDGKLLVAATGTSLLAWPIELPDSAEATARWLEAMTDAVEHAPDAPLAWGRVRPSAQ